MRALLFLALLPGCWVDADTYWTQTTYTEEYAAAYCGWLWGCFGNTSGWTDKEACRASVVESAPDYAGCTYDPDRARQCVKGWSGLPCAASETDDYPTACEEVYDCPDTGQ
jgi:hypothetical protein